MARFLPDRELGALVLTRKTRTALLSDEGIASMRQLTERKLLKKDKAGRPPLAKLLESAGSRDEVTAALVEVYDALRVAILQEGWSSPETS
jgi:hypothetical protein